MIENLIRVAFCCTNAETISLAVAAIKFKIKKHHTTFQRS